MLIKKVLNRKPTTLVIHLQTNGTQKIGVRVDDILKPYTTYINRIQTINGRGKFYLRLPQSPEIAKIKVYDNAGDNFKAVIEQLPLKAKFTVNEIANPVTKHFVRFAQWFSDKAGILDSDQTIYISPTGRFRIDYVDNIVNRQTGEVLTTPARINKRTGIIEIARNKFINYTVPMRMAILIHEFAHFFLNKNMEDETEADINALLILLGLGYSRVEANKVFLQVFMRRPSDGNVQRHKIIENMIKNFEKSNIKIVNSIKANRYYYEGKY